ncbi:MAG: serine hydroxymethyltransferase [Deltaproteobacteria bacterium]|nr:serine hydroxymethyltransferase [Deltaproteobacteria bacterium]MBW2264673.1 serine hydroxymethyltransferase [Deltaproteobacteria bacterium]MBW2317220.1 serine hydroxymethyltransferase [Deltaproteobacteria bacterium]
MHQLGFDIIKRTDPEIAHAIELELERQTSKLDLIASENITSQAVMATSATVLTNKYAEGYPSRRYYGGCQYIDMAEALAIERAKELFSAPYANVQPHSGTQANMAAYFAFLEPGDKILGMDLAHGGHLTHGSPVSFSGRFFDVVSYGVEKDTGMINYGEVRALAERHRPKMIVAGASAYARAFDFETMGDIARSVDAYLMADMAHIAGLVAAGLHPSPVPHADVITSTTHKTLRGPRGGFILAKGNYGKKINNQIFPGIQGGPLMHVIAAKAVAFKLAMSESFVADQRQTVANAKALARYLMDGGLRLVSGGTDNHLILVDLSGMDITGEDAQKALDDAGITVNKNAIPFDKRRPSVTSGIRLGTPSVTTRGMKDKEMAIISSLILDVLNDPKDEGVLRRVAKSVQDLCERFPLYPKDV